jgi:hypothetical protein
MDSQCFLRFLFIQSQTAFLATPIEIPQACSGPMNGCETLFLPADLPFRYQQYPHDLAPMSVELLCLVSCMRDNGSHTLINGETIHQDRHGNVVKE